MADIRLPAKVFIWALNAICSHDQHRNNSNCISHPPVVARSAFRDEAIHQSG
jgi:hypothetical protein